MVATASILSKARNIPANLILLTYGCWIVLLTVTYYAATIYEVNAVVPWLWAGIGLSGVAAILYGVWRYRPKAWLAWLFLALANLLFVMGDTHYNIHQYLLDRPNEFPSLADIFYLLTYPLFVAGIAVFIRRRLAAHSERGALLDAAIFSTGLAMLVWQYLVIPNATADASTLVKIASIAYPLGDILVWAMLVRLLVINARLRPVVLLTVGTVGLLVSDIAYGMSQFYGDWGNGSIIDIGWILFYACWGAAALDPSMKELDKVVVRRPNVHLSRLVLLAATALIAPAVLVVEASRGNAAQTAPTIAVFSAVLFVLVILRMYTLVRTISHREADIEIERQKNEVYAMIAHQLKAPATRVKYVLSMVGSGAFGPLKEKQSRYIGLASKANENLLNTIEETLIITRAESGQLKLTTAPVKLSELCDFVINEHSEQAEAKHIEIETSFPGNVGLIEANYEHLSMALDNLIDNAVKYSQPHRMISVRAEHHATTTSLSITDSGDGIDAEDLPRIFDRFYRSPKHTDLTEGTGIGLYLVKQVVELHGGTVSVRSTKGHGSTFTLELPTAQTRSLQ